MCMMCDGADMDDVLFHRDGLVRRTGWALVPVDGGRGRDWVYTIGLAGRDHPELVIAGVDLRYAAQVLGDLAARVCDGERLDSTDHVTYDDGLTAELVDVHAAHVERGLVNMWFNHYEALGPRPPGLTVRQIVLPDAEFCCDHAGTQPRLDRPDDVVGLSGPNRAERRARQRRSRHGR